MPTVFRFDGFRVVVYPNDHRPAHVHVIGNECEAVFRLNCPDGPVELWEDYGATRSQIKGFERELMKNLSQLCGAWEKFMALREHYEEATERARSLQTSLPRAVRAYYDRAGQKLVIDLDSKLTLSFSPHDVQGLEQATPSQLKEVEISPSGCGIYFPRIDADLYVPGLLEGFLGSKKWMASRLGQLGGQSRSRAKKASSRANGRLGGRPRKSARG